MTNALTLTVSLSTHPEFRYFAEVRHQGRQVAGRFDTRLEVAEWVAKVRASAKGHGFTVTVVDDTADGEIGEM